MGGFAESGSYQRDSAVVSRGRRAGSGSGRGGGADIRLPQDPGEDGADAHQRGEQDEERAGLRGTARAVVTPRLFRDDLQLARDVVASAAFLAVDGGGAAAD